MVKPLAVLSSVQCLAIELRLQTLWLCLFSLNIVIVLIFCVLCWYFVGICFPLVFKGIYSGLQTNVLRFPVLLRVERSFRIMIFKMVQYDNSCSAPTEFLWKRSNSNLSKIVAESELSSAPIEFLFQRSNSEQFRIVAGSELLVSCNARDPTLICLKLLQNHTVTHV